MLFSGWEILEATEIFNHFTQKIFYDLTQIPLLVLR